VKPKSGQAADDRLDPHETEKRIGTALLRLESGQTPIPKAAIREIIAFVRAKESEVSRQRTLTYLRTLPLAAKVLGEDFLRPNRETPAKLKAAIPEMKAWTLTSYWSVSSTFWRWRSSREGKDYPSFLHLKVAKRLLARKNESDVLSPDEVARIAAVTTTVRDRAFVLTLYESGTRVGELLGMRLRNVARSERGGFLLHVDGKTGKRTVPLFESSVPALSAWLAVHPGKGNDNAPLWCGTQATDRLAAPVGYAGMVKVLRLAAKRAGITKRVNPHSFRHSRATAVAQNPAISTSILEKYFGWRAGSPMAETYVHISGREVEDAMARAIGVEKPEAPKKSTMLPRTCGRCSFVNDAASRFCGQCASPLDLVAVQEVEKLEANANTLAALLRKPEVAEFLARELAKAKT
jgi:integrase/recombinase XerD